MPREDEKDCGENEEEVREKRNCVTKRRKLVFAGSGDIIEEHRRL